MGDHSDTQVKRDRKRRAEKRDIPHVMSHNRGRTLSLTPRRPKLWERVLYSVTPWGCFCRDSRNVTVQGDWSPRPRYTSSRQVQKVTGPEISRNTKGESSGDGYPWDLELKQLALSCTSGSLQGGTNLLVLSGGGERSGEEEEGYIIIQLQAPHCTTGTSSLVISAALLGRLLEGLSHADLIKMKYVHQQQQYPGGRYYNSNNAKLQVGHYYPHHNNIQVGSYLKGMLLLNKNTQRRNSYQAKNSHKIELPFTESEILEIICTQGIKALEASDSQPKPLEYPSLKDRGKETPCAKTVAVVVRTGKNVLFNPMKKRCMSGNARKSSRRLAVTEDVRIGAVSGAGTMEEGGGESGDVSGGEGTEDPVFGRLDCNDNTPVLVPKSEAKLVSVFDISSICLSMPVRVLFLYKSKEENRCNPNFS